MLSVLGGLAERDLIGARTAQGCRWAKARGVRLCRRPKLTPHQQREAIKWRGNGEPIRDIARSYNLHNGTICWLAGRIPACHKPIAPESGPSESVSLSG